MRFYTRLKYLFILLCAFTFCMTMSGCDRQNGPAYQGYVEGELMLMAAPTSGDLTNLAVERGQKVKAGQMLFQLDPEPQISELHQAKDNLAKAEANLINLIKGQRETIIDALEAQIREAKANLALANQRLERYKALYKKRAVELDRLDQAQATYDTRKAALAKLEADLQEAKLGSRTDLIAAQKAEVEQAKQNVQRTQWALDEKTVLAPIEAIVFDTLFRQGEFVNAGQAVVSLLAPEYIRIIFFIPATHLGAVKIGDKVAITCDGCSKTYYATISYVAPEAEFTPPVIYSRENNYKLVYRVKVRLAKEDAYILKPGQPVYVKLTQGKPHGQ